MTSVVARLRALEAEGERLLSQMNNQISDPGEETSVVEEVTANMSQRAEEIDGLFKAGQDAPTAHAQAQRHKEKLDEFRTSANRLREELNLARDRHNLLKNVRGDIDSFRMSQVEENDYYLRESGRIEQSHSLADRLLEQAQETRQDMLNQAATLRGVQRRIWHTISAVPGINTLITKINSRQKRNSLVLATIVVVGVLFLFFI